MHLPTILLPALDEEGSIPSVLRAIPERYQPGVLVVDGGSRDRTVEVVRELGFEVIPQEGEGLSAAIRTGVKRARSRIIVTLDADGSYRPSDIDRLLEKLDQGYDLVIGCRYADGPPQAGMLSWRRRSTSHDDTWVRGFGNRFFTALSRSLFGVPVHDVLSGYKAFHRSIFESIDVESPGQAFDAEFILKVHRAGFRIGEVGIVEDRRLAGEPKLNAFVDGARILRVIGQELRRRPPARGLAKGLLHPHA